MEDEDDGLLHASRDGSKLLEVELLAVVVHEEREEGEDFPVSTPRFIGLHFYFLVGD